MGAAFAFGILGLLLLMVVLLLVGVLFLILALVFALIYRSKAKQAKQRPEGRVKTVWKVLPPVFLVLGLLLVYPSVSIILDTTKDDDMLGNAIMEDNYDHAVELLESGVDPDCTMASNQPAQDHQYTLLCRIAEDGLTHVRNADGDLLWANKGDFPEKELAYEQLLLSYGADVNHSVEVSSKDRERPHTRSEADEEGWITGSKHECGKTPFLFAVMRGDLDSMMLFAEYGADVNAVDACGYNAILIAAQLLEDDENGPEILTYLLEQGCNAEAVTNFGQNALDLIDQYTDDDQDEMRAILEAYLE